MSKVVRSVEYESCLIEEYESGTIVVKEGERGGEIFKPTIKKLRSFADSLGVSHFRKNGKEKKTTRELGRSVIVAIQEIEKKKKLQEITNIEIIWPAGVHTVCGRQGDIEWTAKRNESKSKFIMQT